MAGACQAPSPDWLEGRERAPVKRLICCLDGTWNAPDQPGNPTNVTAIMRALRPADAAGVQQVVHYDKGVGTGGPIDRVRGGVFGQGLNANVQQAYRFLINNYSPGDEIYLFGFSRGAYTARSLSGLIGELGLPADERAVTASAIWALYQRPRGEAGRGEAIADMRQHTRTDVRIRALGVWDTVGALGIPDSLMTWRLRRRYRFHDVGLGAHIDRAFQALAIDERRGPFAPALWRGASDAAYADAAGPPTRPIVEQCWFPGVHTDVGGGYAQDTLARLPLAWMIQRVARTSALAFQPGSGQPPTRRDALAPQHASRGWAYLFSYILPCLRILAGRIPPDAGRLTLRARRRATDHAGEPINELVHRCALARFERRITRIRALAGPEQARYTPVNLAAARGHLPVAEHDGTITRCHDDKAPGGAAAGAPAIGASARAG